jgi:hypothetical protein
VKQRENPKENLVALSGQNRSSVEQEPIYRHKMASLYGSVHAFWRGEKIADGNFSKSFGSMQKILDKGGGLYYAHYA